MHRGKMDARSGLPSTESDQHAIVSKALIVKAWDSVARS
jgi:hypothetical protein